MVLDWAHTPLPIRVPFGDSFSSPPMGPRRPHFGIHGQDERYGAASHPAGTGYPDHTEMLQCNGRRHMGHQCKNLEERWQGRLMLVGSSVCLYVSIVCLVRMKFDKKLHNLTLEHMLSTFENKLGRGFLWGPHPKYKHKTTEIYKMHSLKKCLPLEKIC